jgi:hypothetical protein
MYEIAVFQIKFMAEKSKRKKKDGRQKKKTIFQEQWTE